MARKTFNKTYIRAWRQHRGLSLRKLSDRLVDPETFDPVTTPTSLSRIERGLQPYSQPLLEALADALTCRPADLLENDPRVDGDVIDLARRLNAEHRDEAARYLRYLLDRAS